MPVRLLQCLSNSDRGISFRGTSLLGVRNLRGRQPSPQDGVIMCCDSSTVLMTSDITFLRTLRHHFATARNENGISYSPDYFSPPRAKNGLGTRLIHVCVCVNKYKSGLHWFRTSDSPYLINIHHYRRSGNFVLKIFRV